MCCGVVLCGCIVRYRIGSEVGRSKQELVCLTIFRPSRFSRWQALPRDGGLGVHLTAHVRFVSQVALREPWVLFDIMKQYCERRVLVEALDEELRMRMQRFATLLGLDGRERGFDAAEDPTFACSVVSDEILTWREVFAVDAIRTARAQLN